MKYNNTIVNECWVFILLWFCTLNQMRIKNVLMSVWIECSVTQGKTPFSISGKHEFKWYSANGSTLNLLRRTYLSHSLHLVSRSHFLKSLQSNISFMGNHPCLWKHLRKVSIQLNSYQSQYQWLCDYNYFNGMNFNEI